MQFDNADDKKRELERAEGQLMASTANSKESTATLADANKALGANIKDLDNMVARKRIMTSRPWLPLMPLRKRF